MDTSNFKSETNRAACSLDRDLHLSCGARDPYARPVITPSMITNENAPQANLPPYQPQGSSFATNSIDNYTDLVNFIKASCIIGFGASLNPALAVPTQIIIGAAFIYALRFQILKFTSKIIIHGHQ